MLWAATASAAVALAAAPAPQALVLAPVDVPPGYQPIPTATGTTGPGAYRSAYIGAAAVRIASDAAVVSNARAAASAASSRCGRLLPRRTTLAATTAYVCSTSRYGYVTYSITWHQGRVLARLLLIGPTTMVGPDLALRLAHAQEARIAAALASPLAA